MQIDSLNRNSIQGTDSIYPKTTEAGEKELSGIFHKLTEKLRSVTLNDDPTYQKESLLEGEDKDGANAENSALLRVQSMFETSIQSLSEEDLEQMEIMGFSPKDMDPENFVTIADKIRLQLAKAGADVSSMGGLDKDAVLAMTGSVAEAQGVQIALQKTEEILPRMEDGITEGQADYLLQNHLEPTVENMYKAVFSKPQSVGEESGELPLRDAIQMSDPEALLDIGVEQIDHRITENDFPVNEVTEKEVTYLIDHEIPVTKENIILLDKLYQGDVAQEGQTVSELENQVLSRMAEGISQGEKPENTMVLPGFSVQEQAEDAVAVIKNATPELAEALEEKGQVLNLRNLRMAQVSVNLQVEFQATEQNATLGQQNVQENAGQEVSVSFKETLLQAQALMNTNQAARLIRFGLNIQEMDLKDLVQEMEMDVPYISEEENEAIEEVLAKKQQVLDAPVAMLGGFTGTSLREMTLQSVSSVAAKWTSQYSGQTGTERLTANRLAETYEAVGTEVRRDLGDSIQKAFQNVEDLLKELNLENNRDNQRAVRILGYNSMEITTENLLSVREADQTLRGILEKLKPQVVLSMIKNGENPLQMTMKELSDTADQYQNESDESEEMAEFLYRMERMKNISDEERESYIGIYRLIHQVNKRDGAAIGKLLQTGQDITLENLMTAVRTAKAEGKEYVIDDSTGEREGFENISLSITEQVEVAFQSNHLKQAENLMTPSKLQGIGEENYLAMSPAIFHEALEQQEESVEMEKVRLGELKKTLEEAAAADARIYKALDQYNVETNAGNLMAMQSLYERRNEVFQNLTKRRRNPDGTIDETSIDVKNPDISQMLEELMERYGEDCKTPEDMAEAQERLADLAEHAMEGVITEESTGAIDLRTMQNVTKQMSIMSQMAQDEIYHVPIMVADELGNLTLKVVRGEEDKGIVAIALRTESLGDVQAKLQVEDDERISGTFTAERRSTQLLLSEQKAMLEAAVRQESGIEAQIQFAWNESMDVNDIYEGERSGAGQSEIQTSRLYGIARALIHTLGNISSEV